MLGRMVRKSLVKNAKVSIWTLATLSACAALVAMFTTTSLEVGQKMNHVLRQIGANAVVYPATPPDAPATSRTAPDWTAVETAAKQQGAAVTLLRLRAGTVSGRPVAVVAGDPDQLREMTSYWTVTGRRPGPSDECLVGRRAAGVFQLDPGDEVTVAWAEENQQARYRVVGIVDSGDEDDDRIFVTSLGEEIPAFTYALLSAPDGELGIANLQERVQDARVEIRPLRQILHGEQVVLRKINLLSGVALLAVLALTAIGVSVSVLSRVVERRKELALMQALGGNKDAIVRFLLAEHLALGAVASAAGFVLGTLMAWGVAQDVFGVSVSPHWTAFGATLGVTLAVSICAGAVACSRALRLHPAMALRGE